MPRTTQCRELSSGIAGKNHHHLPGCKMAHAPFSRLISLPGSTREEHGFCETDTFQIRIDPIDGDASEGGDGENKFPHALFVFISQEEFEAHLAEQPAAVIRLQWDQPVVRSAVEADKARIMAELESKAEPSSVFHLTCESIARIRRRKSVCLGLESSRLASNRARWPRLGGDLELPFLARSLYVVGDQASA